MKNKSPAQNLKKASDEMESTISTNVPTSEIKKEVFATIMNNSLLDLSFNNGHVSKMSSVIKVSDMFVDYTYQRQAVKAKVKRIIKNFNPDLLGVITCSMREDNTLAIIDGSHRYHALVEMNMKDANVNALVYFGLSIQDEARIFALTNKEHTKPTPSQIFKAGIVSGDDITVNINSIVEKVGASISEKPGANIIRCVATLRRVYTNGGPEVLAKTLETLRDAYPNNNETYNGQMISALGCIYHRYGNKVDQKRMVDSLSKIGTPALAIARAQTMLTSGQTITFTSLPFLIVSKYNVKLKTNKLADFPMNLLPQQVWAKS